MRVHRRRTRSRWRRPAPAQQALLVLVRLYKGGTFTQVSANFEVGATTAWRYVLQATALLAEQASTLAHRSASRGVF
ncbi:transposase family protein [Nocardiopsis algeriensis]|uniref:Transposase Helix-turn-helix domain-containing protein n=1 Tax=Nocardiopsis algeriensis TaxID=1478215 RepID=A0A841IJM0_9ACTN|nr:transposase family protein [Nocardiopsis algeriensis]MBB6118320.1 hypothetical protein [Nocardiopsis algeriensis]